MTEVTYDHWQGKSEKFVEEPLSV